LSGKTVIQKRKKANAKQDTPSTKQNSRSQAALSPAESLFALPRTAGNQAVQRMFHAGLLQPKLKVGAPNDVYEQEADRVAEQVMRMPDATTCNRRHTLGRESGSIQMKPG